MHQFILSNIYSNSKVVRLAIIIGFIMCLNLIFKYINPNFKNIEKLDKLLDINILEENIISNIQSYINITTELIISSNSSITNKLSMLSKQESLFSLINTQFNIELAISQGRSFEEKKRLTYIKELFNDYKKLIDELIININHIQQYINAIYSANIKTNIKTNIRENILSRDDLFDTTDKNINNFISLNMISINDNQNINILKTFINNSLTKIQQHLSYYNIQKLIELNIAQIKQYDIQINTNPPPQNRGELQLSRINLYNKTNNIINIEIANRSNTDLNKAAFNLYHDNLVKLNQ